LRTLLRDDGFAGALLVDQIDQGGFVLVLELVRLEVPRRERRRRIRSRIKPG